MVEIRRAPLCRTITWGFLCRFQGEEMLREAWTRACRAAGHIFRTPRMRSQRCSGERAPGRPEGRRRVTHEILARSEYLANLCDVHRELGEITLARITDARNSRLVLLDRQQWWEMIDDLSRVLRDFDIWDFDSLSVVDTSLVVLRPHRGSYFVTRDGNTVQRLCHAIHRVTDEYFSSRDNGSGKVAFVVTHPERYRTPREEENAFWRLLAVIAPRMVERRGIDLQINSHVD